MAVNKQVKKMFLFGFVSLTGIVDIYIYTFFYLQLQVLSALQASMNGH